MHQLLHAVQSARREPRQLRVLPGLLRLHVLQGGRLRRLGQPGVPRVRGLLLRVVRSLGHAHVRHGQVRPRVRPVRPPHHPIQQLPPAALVHLRHPRHVRPLVEGLRRHHPLHRGPRVPHHGGLHERASERRAQAPQGGRRRDAGRRGRRRAAQSRRDGPAARRRTAHRAGGGRRLGPGWRRAADLPRRHSRRRLPRHAAPGRRAQRADDDVPGPAGRAAGPAGPRAVLRASSVLRTELCPAWVLPSRSSP
mmetsp:Transcript_11179/g.45280  ORF Transcript_11179/g.45280 Transcript_11179/m.45280 type:complete len:251 (+) Transcript_11179:219-971(+)